MFITFSFLGSCGTIHYSPNFENQEDLGSSFSAENIKCESNKWSTQKRRQKNVIVEALTIAWPGIKKSSNFQ